MEIQNVWLQIWFKSSRMLFSLSNWLASLDHILTISSFALGSWRTKIQISLTKLTKVCGSVKAGVKYSGRFLVQFSRELMKNDEKNCLLIGNLLMKKLCRWRRITSDSNRRLIERTNCDFLSFLSSRLEGINRIGVETTQLSNVEIRNQRFFHRLHCIKHFSVLIQFSCSKRQEPRDMMAFNFLLCPALAYRRWFNFIHYLFKCTNNLFNYLFGAKMFLALSTVIASVEAHDSPRWDIRATWTIIFVIAFSEYLKKFLIFIEFQWWNQLTSEDSPYKNHAKCRWNAKV